MRWEEAISILVAGAIRKGTWNQVPNPIWGGVGSRHQRDVAHSSTSKEGTVARARVREATWEVISLKGLEEPELGDLGAQRGSWPC